jgi:hypothetical protein
VFRRTLIIGILLVIITACKSGNPSASGGAKGSGSSVKGDDQITLSSGGTAKQVGNGKLDLVLTYTSDLGDVTIMDAGITPFTIMQKQSGGVPVNNEFIVEGQGKIISNLTTTSGNCTEESRTDGITIINGKMTGGINPNAKEACLLFIKVEIFYNSRTTYLSSCPWSSVATDKENYAFDLKLPLLPNFNKPFSVPNTVWQINNAKLIDLKIDQALTGCNLLTNP